MSNKILITGTSSWIWNYLANNLLVDNKIIWAWRWENNIDWITYIKWDLKSIETLENVTKSSDYFDYVIINAWVWYFDKFENTWMEKHRETIETNLLSPILLLQLLLEENKIKKWIIFMWSIAGKKSMKNWATYAASKFWLRWFAMQLKNELKWIKVHIINPSIVEKPPCHLEPDSGSLMQWNTIKQKTKSPYPPLLRGQESSQEWQNDEITLKNNFKYFWNYKKTTLSEILEVVSNIINWSESRFEIDL